MISEYFQTVMQIFYIHPFFAMCKEYTADLCIHIVLAVGSLLMRYLLMLMFDVTFAP